jgi:hypothetical protein
MKRLRRHNEKQQSILNIERNINHENKHDHFSCFEENTI